MISGLGVAALVLVMITAALVWDYLRVQRERRRTTQRLGRYTRREGGRK